MPITKNVLLNWYSLMKKNEKDSNIFLRWKLTSKVKLRHFLTPPPLHQFSKFNNFNWVCWFLGKNLSNFVPPAWKLNNPCYHNIGTNKQSVTYNSNGYWILKGSALDALVIWCVWFKTDLVYFLLRKQIYWVAKVVHGFEFIASNSN